MPTVDNPLLPRLFAVARALELQSINTESEAEFRVYSGATWVNSSHSNGYHKKLL